MTLLTCELLKLRRTHLWVIVVGLPALATLLGALNYRANMGVLKAGWASLWSQAGLFYGLFFMTIAVAVLASSVWRVEHRGHAWNQFMAAPRPVGTVIAAKLGALAVLVALMQVVMIAAALVAGAVIGLPGLPPGHLVLATLLATIPGVAVAAWQSLLSMVIRNFGAPIGIAGAAVVVSFGVVASGADGLALAFPPALVTRTMSLGSTAVALGGRLTLDTVTPLVVASLVLTAVGWAVAVAHLRRADIAS